MHNPYPWQILMICLTCREHITAESLWTPDGCLVSYSHSFQPEHADHKAEPTPVPPKGRRAE